jgi:hypothetical protein
MGAGQIVAAAVALDGVRDDKENIFLVVNP